MSVPLDQPHYGIGPAGMVRFLRKYATFRGRASMSEFWWGQLTLFLASTVLTAPGLVVYVIGAITMAQESIESPSSTSGLGPSFEPLLPGMGLLMLGGLLSLAFLVPHLALTWRRLQDAGLHGALSFAFVVGSWALGSVVPFVGFAFLVPGMLPSSLRSARFEHAAAPALPPGVDPATWHAARAWADAAAAGHVQQPWPPQQPWQPAPQQWPAQQWPAQQSPAQEWPAQQWPSDQWPAQQWAGPAQQQQAQQTPTHPTQQP